MRNTLLSTLAACVAVGALAAPADARKVKPYVKPVPATLQKSCDKGTLKDCARLGACYLEGFCGTTQDVDKAGALFKKACDGKEQRGCTGLARQRSWGGNDLKPESKELLTKACDAGDSDGCYWLGRWDGDIPKKSEFMKKAYALYIKACDAGDAEACESAGQMNRFSHQDFYESGVAWDEEAATKLFNDACAANLGSSCSYLGGQYEEGRGAAQDYKKAKVYYQKGCTLGDSNGCDWLADLKKRGF